MIFRQVFIFRAADIMMMHNTVQRHSYPCLNLRKNFVYENFDACGFYNLRKIQGYDSAEFT